MNDTLLSINGKDLRGLTDREIDTVIKTLPKGLVTITAASPSTRVAEAATSAPEDEGVVRVKVQSVSVIKCIITCSIHITSYPDQLNHR